MTRWQTSSDKFLKVSAREQYLIVLTGIAVIIFLLYNVVLGSTLDELLSTTKKNKNLTFENKTLIQTKSTFEQALKRDPNSAINAEIEQYNKKLALVDKELLALSSGLIDPVQMRLALLELLSVEKGVALQSFELLDVEKISLPSIAGDVAKNQRESDFVLYKHGIRLELTGEYFQLKEYLSKLEKLKWRFFWQEFNYKLTVYPEGALGVTMYSLSSQREFIGV